MGPSLVEIDDLEMWEELGVATAEEAAVLHGRPLPQALPLSLQGARNIVEDHGVSRSGREDAADALLAAAMRRWVQLASH